MLTAECDLHHVGRALAEFAPLSDPVEDEKKNDSAPNAC